MLPERFWKWLAGAEAWWRKAGGMPDTELTLLSREAQRKLWRRCSRRTVPRWMEGLALCLVVAGMMISWNPFGLTFLGSPINESDVLMGVCGLSVIGLVTAMTLLLRMRYRRVVRDECLRRPCWQCGYSLLHLPEPRCPECGTPFDPAEYERIDAALSGGGEPESNGGQAP